MYTYGMISPFIRELGGESGGESSISARYDEIRSDDGIDERASASGGGDDEISSEDGSDEQSADEEDVPKPPTASTRSAWVRVARWTIGVSIPLIAGSATIVSTRSRGITFDVFNFFTNGLSFLMLLLATIILRTPFPTLTPSLFIRIMGLHVFEPLSQIWLSFGAQFLPAQFTVCLQSVVPALTYLISLIFRIQSISIRKKSDQAKLGGLVITFCGAFLIGKYNGPTIAAHRLVNENWTWPLCLVIASVLCSACHNVLMENTMEKYDVEALWLATIVRFSAMIPSLIIALVTTRGRAYKWVMGWDFNTFCWVFAVSFIN
ncbi:WAT1-related protein At1g44800-like [Pyrus communis]|uniref:WAT1-related protein At1g44800-like n=1 Tax=Pyrus communis TaxID=23211 RepID=UPI0035BF148C